MQANEGQLKATPKGWSRPKFERRNSCPFISASAEPDLPFRAAKSDAPKFERRNSCPFVSTEPDSPFKATKSDAQVILSPNVGAQLLSSPAVARKFLRSRKSCPDLGRIESESNEIDLAPLGDGPSHRVSTNVALRRRFWTEARLIYWKACSASQPSTPRARIKHVFEITRQTVKSLMTRVKVIEAFHENLKEKQEERKKRSGGLFLRQISLPKSVASIDGLSDVSDREEIEEKVQKAEKQWEECKSKVGQQAASMKFAEVKLQYLKDLLPTVLIAKKALEQLQALAEAHQHTLDSMSGQIDAAKRAVQSATSNFWAQLKETVEGVSAASPLEQFNEKLTQLCEDLGRPEIIANMHNLRAALEVTHEIGTLAEVAEEAVKTEMSQCRQTLLSQKEISGTAGTEEKDPKDVSEASLSTFTSQNPDDEQGAFFSEASLATNSSQHSEPCKAARATDVPLGCEVILTDTQLQTAQSSDTSAQLPEISNEPTQSPKHCRPPMLERQDTADEQEAIADCLRAQSSMSTGDSSSNLQSPSHADKAKLPPVSPRRSSCPAHAGIGVGKTKVCVDILRGMLLHEDEDSQDNGKAASQAACQRRGSLPAGDPSTLTSRSARAVPKRSDVSPGRCLNAEKDASMERISDIPMPRERSRPPQSHSQSSGSSDWALLTGNKSASSTTSKAAWHRHRDPEPTRNANDRLVSESPPPQKNPLRGVLLPQLPTEQLQPKAPRRQSDSRIFMRRVSSGRRQSESASGTASDKPHIEITAPQSRRASPANSRHASPERMSPAPLGRTTPSRHVSASARQVPARPEVSGLAADSSRQGKRSETFKSLKPPGRRHSSSRFLSH